jgi:hypothetical protein
MKIDIGPNGKILGTKRVSSNGQISGFTEYAGLDVLVILPGSETPVIRRGARDVVAEVETVVQEQMRLAFREYESFKHKFPTPEQAAEKFLELTNPRRLTGIVEKADQWIKDQVATVEAEVRKRLPKKNSKAGKERKE